MIGTYSKFVVEVTHSEHINPETFVGTKRIYANLLAHLEKLTPKYRVLANVFLVLHSEVLETGFELLKLFGHFL